MNNCRTAITSNTKLIFLFSVRSARTRIEGAGEGGLLQRFTLPAAIEKVQGAVVPDLFLVRDEGMTKRTTSLLSPHHVWTFLAFISSARYTSWLRLS